MADFRVPRVNYREYPDSSHVLMQTPITLVPNDGLGQVYEKLSNEAKFSISQELHEYTPTARRFDADNYRHPRWLNLAVGVIHHAV